MPKGPATIPTRPPATNKTEFLRYLNVYETEAPGLRRLADYYRQHNRTRHTFGMWLHARHLKEFQHAYHSWWLHHPSLWTTVYSDCVEEVSPR